MTLRWLMFALLALVLGATVAVWLHADPGYALLRWNGWVFETSLLGFVAALLLGVLAGQRGGARLLTVLRLPATAAEPLERPPRRTLGCNPAADAEPDRNYAVVRHRVDRIVVNKRGIGHQRLGRRSSPRRMIAAVMKHNHVAFGIEFGEEAAGVLSIPGIAGKAQEQR